MFCRLRFRPQWVNWVKVDDDVPSHAVITGTDLLIENLNKSYNGTYRCMASNSVGESFDDYILYVYGTQVKSSPSPSLYLLLCFFLHITCFIPVLPHAHLSSLNNLKYKTPAVQLTSISRCSSYYSTCWLSDLGYARISHKLALTNLQNEQLSTW